MRGHFNGTKSTRREGLVTPAVAGSVPHDGLNAGDARVGRKSG